MGIFLRKLWKNKPKQYGPWKFVHRSLFHNAGKMGIDPLSLQIAKPMWAGTKDYSKNGFDTVNSNITYTHNTISFDGSNSTMIVSDSRVIDLSNLTVLAQVTPAALGSENFIVSRDDLGTAYANWWFGGTTGNKLSFLARIGSTFAASATTSSAMTVGVQTTVGITYDGSTVRLYVDGIEAPNSKASRPGSLNSTHEIDIGCRRYGNLSGLWNGEINYTLIFDTALSPENTNGISENPWQLWQPYISPIYFDFAVASTTATPTTIAPTTSAPTTPTPTTIPPTTPLPTTAPPTSLPPTTIAPTTAAPTSPAPTTPSPTTPSPTTPAPTTQPPTTNPPTTSVPTTVSPTTPVPTTPSPTSAPPTTPAPTTVPPTTTAPTTSVPTTPAPTLAPTTLAPTLPPTTLAPTTSPPTLPPTTLAPTTAPPIPIVTRRGISNMGFSMREQWR